MYYQQQNMTFLSAQFSKYKCPNFDGKFIADTKFSSLLNKSNSSQKSPKLAELKLKKFEDLEVTDQLLKFLVEAQLFNSTYVCFSPNGSIMMYLLQMLVSNGFTPSIVNSHNTIMQLSIAALNLRFINMTYFLPATSYWELGVTSFFPEHFLNKFTVRDNFKPDTPACLIHVTDDDCTIREKTDFFNTYIRGKKCLIFDELIAYASQVCICLIQSTLDFLSECSMFQESTSSAYQVSNKAFYNPLHDNCSKTGYIFKLYQMYELNEIPMFTVPKENMGVHLNASKVEYEVISYYVYKNRAHDLVHAFSPYGQTKFKESAPDCVDLTLGGLAIYVHGCWIHKHCCSLNKKHSREESEAEDKLFMKKVEAMMKNPKNAITSFQIIWECDWVQLKKYDPLVKDFMANHFKPRPMRRLVARDSCEQTYSILTNAM
jgi:hypothetical protein